MSPQPITGIALHYTYSLHIFHVQNVPRGKVNILGGPSIGYSKQNIVYTLVSYSELSPR
jgi:hypothetical protein